MIFKTGWFGRSSIDEYFKDDDGRNSYLQRLIVAAKTHFKDSDIEIHFNVQPSTSKRKKYLILLEHEYIRPQNLFCNWQRYRQVFGWDLRKNRLHNFHYVHYPWNSTINKTDTVRNIRYSMICSNRNLLFGSKDASIYNKRQHIIDYCENSNQDFALYGAGWEQSNAQIGALSKARFEMSKRGLLKPALRKRPLNFYHGTVTNKIDILKTSKFNFCFENISPYPGYVSEKLWDSMAAGAIPIYWPACSDTIYKLINNDLFIDASQYESLDDLFRFCNSLTDTEIRDWSANIVEKISCIEPKVSIDKYVNSIIQKISADLALDA